MPITHHGAAVSRDLDAVFTVRSMRQAWKETVRAGLRRQPLADLHDFMDVHRNLNPYLATLRSEVLSGQYRPQPPEITLLEKRDGIPRRLGLPAPADAILMQTIVNMLEPAIASGQPHPNAFYAQSHAPLGPADVDGTFAYPWWLLWPQFQERIWQFTRQYDFVVVTDIANYFDCIPLSALRNRVAAFGAFSETVLNFLFYLLDAFVWRPFYMPPSGVGLPQINFDAPRLLAHAFLFPIDAELQARTGGDFVRWMDDINCGVPSRDAARRLLRGLETVLNSLSIRLNTSKTKILGAQAAVSHFWIAENRSLTILTNLARAASPGSYTWQLHRKKARKQYRAFRVRERLGQWDKVCKRYLTLFGELRDPRAERDAPHMLSETPGLRGAVFRYYTLLGPSSKRLKHIVDFLESGHCLDDASLFEATRTLIAWRGQTRGRRRNVIVSLVDTIQTIGSETPTQGRLTTSGVASAIWLLAKYGSEAELVGFLHASRSVWTRSAWAARQAAAASPLCGVSEQAAIRDGIVQSGLTEALRVLASIGQLVQLTTVDQQLKSYLLHPPSTTHPYPLEKVIVGRTLLHGRLPAAQKRALRRALNALIVDPCYRALLARPVST